MRVFVTGATGFIGSAVVKDLIEAGHQVLGLSRSAEGDQKLKAAGAEVHRGDIYDLGSIHSGAARADGVIHTAFNHDFSRFRENCETDRTVIETLGDALGNSGGPLVSTSGIAIVAQDKVLTETDRPLVDSSVMPRVASEEAAEKLLAGGANVSVVRLSPSVHDAGDYGFVPMLINAARNKGVSAYVNGGHNRWPAVHRLDAARLYRLALEKGKPGARYHAVADSGIPFREIATLIGEKLQLPVIDIPASDAPGNFGWLAKFTELDIPASSEWTRTELGWKPQGVGLLEDMSAVYF